MSVDVNEQYIGEAIEKLTAPPVQDKGRGRRIGKIKKNKEYCEACRDGGELVCCERCPISYHPTCCDPPCDAADLPDKWICRQCLQGREPQSLNSPDEKSAYNSLASDAAKVNPTQFSIPTNVGASVSLPGMAKPKPAQLLAMRGRAGIKAKRAYHEIDNNGLVQLARMTSESLRLCHACDTSSRTHQLIACDFCPLYFHQDCLDPPLTNPPTAKWMCPAHPEKFFIANRELFQSQRKLVSDLFSSEVDPQYVITKLLHKNQRSDRLRASNSLLSKTSVSLANHFSFGRKKRSIVPQGVKDAYKKHAQKDRLNHDEEAKLFIESLQNLRKYCGTSSTEKTKIDSSSMLENDVSSEIKEKKESPNMQNFKAVLCPVGIDAAPILINEDLVKIGKSEMCEVTLNSNCLAMSDTHAVLLHDGNRRWEILNYSQFGLEVDGIRYGLELPENDQPKIAKKQEKDPILERIHQIKGSFAINDSGKLEWRDTVPPCSSSDEESENLTQPVKSEFPPENTTLLKCGCSAPSPGWEAAAPVSHGSTLKIGCLKFLFAIR